jgi:hypothetical protein
MGFGDFSTRNEGDMLLRNKNTGGLELYDISNNQITAAFFLGNVGARLAVRGHRPDPRSGRVRLGLAQREHRRIRGLRNRQ